MLHTSYFDSVLDYIGRKQNQNSEHITRISRYRIFLHYLSAIVLQSLLFGLSHHFNKEPEVAVALFYLMVSMFSTLFLGYGPGLLSAILAAFSVNYYYVGRHQAEVTAHTVAFLLTFVFLYGFMVSILGLLHEAIRKQNHAKKLAEDAVFHREELLQIIAHDLRQPLGAAMIQVELRNRMLQDDPKAKTLGDDILKSLKRMDRLVSDVLDTAKSEQGKLKLNLEMADLKEVAEQAISIVSEAAKRKHVNISLVTDEEANYYCWVDFDRMTRVLINLLGNSLKFTPSEGQITVELSYRNLHTLQVKVSDTGPGIPPAEAASLFTKNWQNPDTAHLGNGLGLYICKGIIEAHFGKIWYEANSSAAGNGAIFIFSLPKQQVFASQSSPAPHKPELRKSTPIKYQECNGG